MSSLAEFFDAMVPMLRGTIPPAEFERRLGAVRPTTRRLAFYRTLMRRNVQHLLRQLFPATQRALAHLGRWESLVEQFERRHPLRHWEPNDLGAPFPGFLAELAVEEGLPRYLEEIADFEWLCFAVTYAPEDDSELGLDSRLQARQYEHDIPSFVLEPELAEPAAEITPVLVFRSPLDRRAHYRRPLVTELVAIAARTGAPLPPGFAEAAVAAADRRLVELGILPPRLP